jgi:hypothetical protein
MAGAAGLGCKASCQVSMSNIINWHQNPLNPHWPACECKYTHQLQQQQDEPHQLPAVGSRDCTATPTTPQGQVNWQACCNHYKTWWWIHGRRCLECSREAESCTKAYYTGFWNINLLRTYGLTSRQWWLDARGHVPEPFRSSPVSNGLSSNPSSTLPSPLSQAPMGPPRLQLRHSENHLPSTNPDPCNRC